jgi:hypothetical protein
MASAFLLTELLTASSTAVSTSVSTAVSTAVDTAVDTITKRNFHTLLGVVILRYQPETPLGEPIRYI